MILLWFLLGIALILGIARYNESNKLFWTLLFSYIIGFTGAKIALQAINGNEQGNGNLAQVCPTQEQIDTMPAVTLFQAYADLTSSKVTASNPVSQDSTPVQSENNVTLSKVFGRTRDQPILTLEKPPELCSQKDSLTHHEPGLTIRGYHGTVMWSSQPLRI